MPEITNLRTLEAGEALRELVRIKRPMLGAMRMRQLARLLGARVEDVDAERRKLLETYGDHDADGQLQEDNGKIAFTDDVARKKFADAWTELLACKWECPLALRVKDFGGLDTEPALLIALGELLEEDAEEDVRPEGAKGSKPASGAPA